MTKVAEAKWFLSLYILSGSNPERDALWGFPTLKSRDGVQTHANRSPFLLCGKSIKYKGKSTNEKIFGSGVGVGIGIVDTMYNVREHMAGLNFHPFPKSARILKCATDQTVDWIKRHWLLWILYCICTPCLCVLCIIIFGDDKVAKCDPQLNCLQTPINGPCFSFHSSSLIMKKTWLNEQHGHLYQS